jgi:hypothetical protein
LKNGEKKTIDELGYDNTKTAIEGGLVTSGTVQLAGDDSNIKAGITGEGTSDNSVRIWAGASKENKETAPFRVQQDGKTTLTYVTIYSEDSNKNALRIGDGMISTSDDNRNNGVKIFNEYKSSGPSLNGYTKGHINIKSTFGINASNNSRTEIDIVDGEIILKQVNRAGITYEGILSGDSIILSDGTNIVSIGNAGISINDNIQIGINEIQIGNNITLKKDGSVIFSNLGTTKVGLSTGQLYRTTAGVVCIVV